MLIPAIFWGDLPPRIPNPPRKTPKTHFFNALNLPPPRYVVPQNTESRIHTFLRDQIVGYTFILYQSICLYQKVTAMYKKRWTRMSLTFVQESMLGTVGRSRSRQRWKLLFSFRSNNGGRVVANDVCIGCGRWSCSNGTASLTYNERRWRRYGFLLRLFSVIST